MRPVACALALSLALLSAAPARAAAPPPPIPAVGAPPVRVFNDADGLASNVAFALAYDAEGLLWAGSDQGLSVYDGRAWRSVTLPAEAVSPRVIALLSTADGRLWAGSRDGVLQRADGRWTLIPNAALGFNPLGAQSLLELELPDGRREVWAANAAGVARFDGRTWRPLDAALPDLGPGGAVNALLADGTRPGAVWLGTTRGLLRWEEGQLTHVFAADAALRHASVTELQQTEDGDGRRSLWVATRGSGLLRLGPEGLQRYTPESSPLPGERLETLLADRDARGRPLMWVGTEEHGLAAFFYEEGRWELLHAGSSGLPSNRMRSLLRAPGGLHQLWVGTAGGGLARLTLGRWRQLVSQDSGLPPGPVNDVAESRSASGESVYWFATESGLARYERGSWRVLTERDGLPNRITWSVHASSAGADEVLWVGTSRGLVRLAEGGARVFTERNSGLPHDVVTLMLETSALSGRRELVFGTSHGGLARERDGRIEPLAQLNAQLPSGRVWGMAESTSPSGEQVLWLGLMPGGLARCVGGRVDVFHPGNSPLPSEEVRSVLVAEGGRALWVGTSLGAVRVDLSGPTLRWERVRTRESGREGAVHTLAEDARGRIHLFTTQGAVQLVPTPGRTWWDAPHPRRATLEDGLPSHDTSVLQALADSHGRLWVGTHDGAAYLDPAEEADDGRAAPLVFARPEVQGAMATPAPGAVLPHDHHALRFELALLGAFRERETEYRTQLLGFDPAPSAWSRDPVRNYTNLPAGSYTFEARARDARGVEAGPLRRAFQVRPAPWATWWAVTGYVLAALALGHAVLRWRLQKARTRQRALEAMVAERTAELARAVAKLSASEQEAVAARNEALRLADSDPLTGLPNRRKLLGLVQEEMKAGARYGVPFTLVMLDVDHFKRVNDLYGHEVGDRVLQQVGSALRGGLRDSDVVARWGGEEFMVLLRHTPLAAGLEVTEKLRTLLAATPMVPVGTITASFGATEYVVNEPFGQLSARVDALLYEAKRSGRNRVVAA